MIGTQIQSTTLAEGIAYPPEVTEAYQAQEATAAEYTAAIVAIAEAEALLETARSDDHAALAAAAAAGAGHPGKEKAPAAERAVAYAHAVGEQVQTRYLAAADAMKAVMREHADAMVPPAIQAAREAIANYAALAAQVQRLASEANALMQNAAYSFNVLRPYLRHLGSYEANWMPVTAQLPDPARQGNVGQVADRLERVQAELATPTPKVTAPKGATVAF